MPKGTRKRRAKLGLEPDSWLFLPKPPLDLSFQGSPAPARPLPPASILHQKKANCGQHQLPGVPHSLTSPSARPLHLEARTVGAAIGALGNWHWALREEQATLPLPGGGVGPRSPPVVPTAEPPAPRESAAPDPKPEMRVSRLCQRCSSRPKQTQPGGEVPLSPGPPLPPRPGTLRSHSGPRALTAPVVPAQTAPVRLWFCFQQCHFLAVREYGQASPNSLSPDSLPGAEP